MSSAEETQEPREEIKTGADTPADQPALPSKAENDQTNAYTATNESATPDQHTFNEALIANWTRRLGIFTGLLVSVTALLVVATGISAYFLWESDQGIKGQIAEMQKVY